MNTSNSILCSKNLVGVSRWKAIHNELKIWERLLGVGSGCEWLSRTTERKIRGSYMGDGQRLQHPHEQKSPSEPTWLDTQKAGHQRCACEKEKKVEENHSARNFPMENGYENISSSLNSSICSWKHQKVLGHETNVWWGCSIRPRYPAFPRTELCTHNN